MLKLYKTKECPVCADLATYLDSTNRAFKTFSLELPSVLADLRCNGVFAMSAPILEDEGRYLLPEAMILPRNKLFVKAVEDFLKNEDE